MATEAWQQTNPYITRMNSSRHSYWIIKPSLKNKCYELYHVWYEGFPYFELQKNIPRISLLQQHAEDGEQERSLIALQKEAANHQLLSEQPAVLYAVDKQAHNLSFARTSSEPNAAKITTRLYIW
jgi:hypothetical protein